MQRFRQFLHRPLNVRHLGDTDHLAAMDVRGRFIPDPIEAFDEIDLALSLDQDRDMVITIAVENGEVERLLFGWAPPGDDDADARALTEAELAAFLEGRGTELLSLMEYLTCSP